MKKFLVSLQFLAMMVSLDSGRLWANYTVRHDEPRDSSTPAFYVSPAGLPTGNGSLANPWDLKTALNHPAVIKPGDTIYLRGGIYNVPPIDLGFSSRLIGTAQEPIKVISYPGEWAVIDGNLSFSAIKTKAILTVAGQFTWFMNFEITNTETGNRKTDQLGDARGTAVDDLGTGTKLINLVIHDAGQGIGAWAGGGGNEYYGNIIYNNGWDAPDRTHGHGLYVQNRNGAKLFEDNFVFNAFSQTSQVYGSASSYNRNLTWIGNVFFNGGMAWWGPNISNLVVVGNFTYKHQFKLGNMLHPSNTSAKIENNYFMHGVLLDELSENVTFKNNTVWNEQGANLLSLSTNSFWVPGKFTIERNTYYRSSLNSPNGQFKVNYSGAKKRVQIVKRFIGDFTFDKVTGSQQAAYSQIRKSWRDDFGFDINGIFIDSAPTATKVFVKPNKFAPGRGNIVVYNWSRLNEVIVDVGTILNPGDYYEIRNVQDYFGDVETGHYLGTPISVRMINRNRAKPIGYDQTNGWYHDPLQAVTFPVFGAFIITRTNQPSNAG